MKFEPLIQSLIKKKIMPGMSVLVARRDQILLQNHYGYKSIIPEREKLHEHTLYDTASLTKPLVTSFLIAYMIENKMIRLDTEIKKVFPDFPFSISVLQLLTHTSGFPAWFPFFLYPADYRIQLNALSLESAPGKKVNYSCPGYILLYYLIEKVSGRCFSEMAGEIIFDELNLRHTYLKVPENLKIKAAPTEKGNYYEKRMATKIDRAGSRAFDWKDGIIRGDTHDLNSYHLGGTAGNSGLFSTTGDLFRLTLEFFPETATILKPPTLKLFRKNFTPGEKSHRSLGFKLNTSLISSGGKTISPFAIGHSGFTGTSVWLEPETQSTYILLSNQIHPRVRSINFNRYRRRLHNQLKTEFNLP
ncbi:MAG: beta-lactamase family protein [Candidatus Aminicenantes bacterium]|nr:beta-lactamase family protein [Candidatus Aminicenantes bacterium]